MTAWQRWVQRPQGLWIRKVLFQVHLWIGLGTGLYVVAISISGSALVYLPELTREFSRRTVALAESGHRMSVEELTEHVQRVYPTYEVDNIREAQTPDEPDDVVLERAHIRIERLFDPYTGSDLGNPRSVIARILEWLADLHDNLLAGRTGRLVNGIASCFVTLLSLTGAIVWWPGIKNWRRSTRINWRAHFPRLNWDLHSAIGFWCWFFVLIWGISGIYFCLPAVLGPPIHAQDIITGSFFSTISKLHVGSFDWFTRALWTILGLAPAIAAGTGAVMWWNRVLRKKFRRSHWQAEHAAAFDNFLVSRE